ncbi:RNA exonuclease NGL2, partial [Phenoliferia sp. Uapishka_3]
MARSARPGDDSLTLTFTIHHFRRRLSSLTRMSTSLSPKPPSAASSSLLAELPSGLSTPSRDPATSDEAQALALAKQLEKEVKQKERAEKKAAAKLSKPPPGPAVAATPLFLPREWAEVQGLKKLDVEGRKVSIMTWNMLAQALVRRELFPGSDFLKGGQRLPTLMAEIMHYAPDIACLQEVDRLPAHLPILSTTYSYTSFIGYPNKAHGLLIAYKESVFEKAGQRGLRLDELPLIDSATTPTPPPPSSPARSSSDIMADEFLVWPPLPSIHGDSYDPTTSAAKSARRAAGLSRSTRNVALMVALKFKDREGGIIIATTHLFWHPQHVFERARQTGILLRELRRFRDDNPEWQDWPAFLAGDLNTQPCESTYRLIMGLPLTDAQEEELDRSTVVHESVDKLHDKAHVSTPKVEWKEGDPPKESLHTSKVIRNSRPGEEADGLVGLAALRELFAQSQGIRSAYGEAFGKIPSEERSWYSDRSPEVGIPSGPTEEDPEIVRKRKDGTWEERVRRGDFEPKWSNFTPMWRCTLDYIFLLPPATVQAPTAKPPPRFTSLLKIHPDATLGGGLPKLGVEPSDHISIASLVELF